MKDRRVTSPLVLHHIVFISLSILCVLLFPAGTSQKIIFLYKTPGHDVTLSCCCFDLSCSTIKWFFNKNTYEPLRLAESGQVVTDSARAARLRVDDCSLVINNITAADAGLYYCVTEGPAHIVIYLNVLTSESYLFKSRSD